MKCKKCDLTFDRDVVETLNLFEQGCGRSPGRFLMKLIKPDRTEELLKVFDYYSLNYLEERTVGVRIL